MRWVGKVVASVPVLNSGADSFKHSGKLAVDEAKELVPPEVVCDISERAGRDCVTTRPGEATVRCYRRRLHTRRQGRAPGHITCPLAQPELRHRSPALTLSLRSRWLWACAAQSSGGGGITECSEKAGHRRFAARLMPVPQKQLHLCSCRSGSQTLRFQLGIAAIPGSRALLTRPAASALPCSSPITHRSRRVCSSFGGLLGKPLAKYCA